VSVKTASQDFPTQTCYNSYTKRERLYIDQAMVFYS